jgi:hypothetical protein
VRDSRTSKQADFVRWQLPKTVNDTNTLEQVVNTLYTGVFCSALLGHV